jgi:hypothetical protein
MLLQNPCPGSRAGRKNSRMIAGLLFVAFFELPHDVVDRIGLYQAYGAPAKTRAGHAAAKHAFFCRNRFGDRDQDVQFPATDRIIILQRGVARVHQLAHSRPVTGLERAGGVQRALVFRNDMLRTPENLRRKLLPSPGAPSP